ncbi:MAG: Tagaturonate reductase [Paenibacillaceae bacterium]|jgi:tagaturonate reductase|nr:Tagaturonate reductase [Paenibacillaceae bacterium]
MTALSKTQLANPEAIAALPEKVLQFGEGNFLRGFVDWMIHKLNEQNLFNGRVAVVQPIAQGLTPMLNDQDGLYTLLLRGLQNGQIVEEKDIISSISRGINPYEDFAAYLGLAESPELRFVISNTTEAGIAYSAEDRYDDAPPATFPGKLTVLLHKRFTALGGAADKGLVIIPCELIDRNGDNLKKIVLRLAEEWNLGSDFAAWIENSNYFLNTLVDRIVTGYPRDEIAALTEELGYEDKLLNTAEIFHLWVIEGDKRFAEELPFHKIGLDVIWTDDMTPYRTRKVRILNGAHTMTVLAAYLYGVDTVKECMDDELIRSFMEKGIYNEVIPTLDLPESELKAFAAAVTERFANPFIRHYLLSISLNSTSKFKTRVLPSILEYVNRKGELPKVLSFSLAALLAFYQSTELKDNALVGKRPAGNEYQISDDLPVLQLFASLWSKYDGSREAAGTLVEEVLSHTEMWGQNLNEVEGFTALVSDYLHSILTNGVAATLKDVI